MYKVGYTDAKTNVVITSNQKQLFPRDLILWYETVISCNNKSIIDLHSQDFVMRYQKPLLQLLANVMYITMLKDVLLGSCCSLGFWHNHSIASKCTPCTTATMFSIHGLPNLVVPWLMYICNRSIYVSPFEDNSNCYISDSKIPKKMDSTVNLKRKSGKEFQTIPESKRKSREVPYSPISSGSNHESSFLFTIRILPTTHSFDQIPRRTACYRGCFLGDYDSSLRALAAEI